MACAPSAYFTAVMHSMKHPTQPVCGLLLGRRSDGTADAPAYVAAAVPITHNEVASAPHPITSVAIKQVAAVGRSTGRRIVGLYVANERLDDSSLHEHTVALLSYLSDATESKSLTVWLLNNRTLKPHDESDAAAVKLYAAERTQSAPGSAGASVRVHHVPGLGLRFAKWNPDALAASDEVPTRRVMGKLIELLDGRRHMAVVDFEEHLEDCANDYFNAWVEETSL